jgi:hypothetical protein
MPKKAKKAIKGERWFLGRCYKEVRKLSKLAYLANEALEFAFGKVKTQGHIKQAVGAVQAFLQRHGQYKSAIINSSPLEPYNLAANNTRACNAWKKFLQARSGKYGPRKQYDWNTLKGYLTQKYGGTRTGGGGGDYEFEIVLRLVAEFI